MKTIRKCFAIMPLAIIAVNLGLFLAGTNRIMASAGKQVDRDQNPEGENAESAQINLNSLIAELLRANPELQAARKRYEVSLTRPAQENALPDPTITMGWNSNGNPFPGAGLGVEPTSNVGFQISQELPYPGKRSLKGFVALKESESEAQAYRARELELVAQLKSSFHELSYLNEAIELLRRNREVLLHLAKVAEIKYSSGKTLQQDLIKSQLEISLLENKLIVADRKKATVIVQINALLNRPLSSPLGRPEPTNHIPSLDSLQSMQSRAEKKSPSLRAQQALIDGKHLGVQIARKEYYPNFNVMGGYYNMGRMKDMWEFKIGVSIPAYFWRKQRFGLEESSLRLTEAQKTYRAREQTVSLLIQEEYLAAETAHKLMELYSKRILPQAEIALESSLSSYETGGLDFLSVLSNFNTILDSEMNYYEQKSEYLKALANLEGLVGEPFSEAGKTEVPQ